MNVETTKQDRYGRQVGKVLLNGQDINLMQIERGMAWFYRQYQREQSSCDRKLYEAAEDATKALRRGLWSDAEPVPPWDFRHHKPILDQVTSGWSFGRVGLSPTRKRRLFTAHTATRHSARQKWSLEIA